MATKTIDKKKKKFKIFNDHELCKACGLCMEYCPIEGIEADPLGKAQFTKPDECIGCMRCVWLCPDFANWVEEIDGEEDQGETSEAGLPEKDQE